MFPPVTIELVEPQDIVLAGETVPLRFSVTRPTGELGAVVIPAAGVTCIDGRAHLDTDLISNSVTLYPGETTSVMLGVRFAAPGEADWSNFEIEVNSLGGLQKEGTLVRLPARPFRVTPSLDGSLHLSLTRVCTYGDAAKVEVVARNGCPADLTNLELEVCPPESVRLGPLKKCVPVLRPGDEVKFDLVVAASEVEFRVSALVGGARLEGTRRRPIPSHESRPDAPPAFAFLEPRALTTDRITLTPEKGGAEQPAANGVYRVHGGKTRYRLTVFPTHPLATRVRLYKAAGRVDVEAHPVDGRGWPFTITVVENPLLTQLVRLDYDVELPDAARRGEVYLSIRPTGGKWWAIALTAGITTTLRGAAGLVPALASMRGDGGFESALERLPELFERRWTELIQLASILLIRGILWLADTIWRPIEEG